MKIISKLSILLLVFCFSYRAMAQFQTATNGTFNTIRAQTPATPEMALYQRYGDVPVDYSTGIANVGVPIAELKLKDFVWPINLSYHGGGNKVSDFSSVIGLGWVLNASGFITSSSPQINGSMGEEIKRRYNLDKRYYPYFGVCENTNLIYYNDADVFLASTNVASNNLYRPIMNYLTMPTMSLKMLFRDTSFVTVPISDNKISADGSILTDTKGNRYFFYLTGGNTAYTNCQLLSATDNSYRALTKIITYSGDSIVFNYERINYSYSEPNYETKQTVQSTDCLRCQTDAVPDNKNCPVTNIASELLIKSIVASNGQKIVFQYAARNDHPNNRRLESILVQQLSDGLYVNTDWFTFGQSYFGTAAADNLRLRLDNVKNIINPGSQQIYTFQYDNNATLPNRLSKSIDLAGLFNNQPNTTLIPSLSLRNSVLSYAKAGILTKITYPTGGSSVFDYGFSPWGSLRIEKILDYTASGVPASKKSYDYGGTGVYIVDNFTNIDQRYFFGHGANGTVISGLPLSALELITCTVFTEQSTPISSFMGGWTDQPKYHGIVTEFKEDFNNNIQGEFGKTVYKYNTNMDFKGRQGSLASFGPKLTEKEVYAGLSNQLVYKEESFYSVAEDYFPVLDFWGQPKNPRDQRVFVKRLELVRDEMSHLLDGSIPAYRCYGKEFFQFDYILDIPVVYLDRQTTRNYDNGQVLYTEKNFAYNKLGGEIEPYEIATTASDGILVKQQIKYPFSDLAGLDYSSAELGANVVLRNANVVVPVWSRMQKGAVTTAENQVYYASFGNKALPVRERINNGGNESVQSRVTQYDPRHNILEVLDRELKYTAYRFSSKNELTAQFVNARVGETGYASFDNGGETGFSFSGGSISGTNFYTGKSSYQLAGATISKANLQPGKKYVLVVYVKNGMISLSGASTVSGALSTPMANGWNLQQQTFVPSSSSISITGYGFIDELKVFPADAKVNTFVYTDLYNQLSSKSDERSSTVFFDYQSDGRLWSLKDQYGNIIKQFCYNYAGQTVDCSTKPAIVQPTFYAVISIDNPSTEYPSGLGSPDMDYYADVSIKLFMDAAQTIPYIPTSDKVIAVEETLISDLGSGPVQTSYVVNRTVTAGSSQFFMGRLLLSRIAEIVDPNYPWLNTVTSTSMSYQVVALAGSNYNPI